MEHRRPRPPSPVLRGLLLLIAVLLLPVGGVLLLHRAMPPVPAQEPIGRKDSGSNSGQDAILMSQDPALKRFPWTDFHVSPDPVGEVALTDLSLQSYEFAYSVLCFPVWIRCHSDAVTLCDWWTRKQIWTGPLSAATFTAQMAGGDGTLKDSAGHVLLRVNANTCPWPRRETRHLYATQHLVLKGTTGSVTVKNVHGQTLAQIPIRMVLYYMWEARPGWYRTKRAYYPPSVYKSPAYYDSPIGVIRPGAVGSLYLTYRDATGRIVRWSKVSRDANGGYGCAG